MAENPQSYHARRRRSHRRKTYMSDDAPLEIRIGNRRAAGFYLQIQASSSADAGRFLRMVDDTIRLNPEDPIIISINGYQPWLEDVLKTCIDDRWCELPELNRELQFADTVKFPERSNRRKKLVPWSFIIDEMNVPEVYYWTFDQTPPSPEYTSDVDNYRLRLAVWTCSQGAFMFDDQTPVTIIFTQPTTTSEYVIGDLLFPNLYNDDEFGLPRTDEERVCWVFLRMYWLVTNWQNIIREIERELEEAEFNSHGRQYPVKIRSRAMHKQVDRIYELKQYLRFHTRSFNKLVKLKASIIETGLETEDPVWDEMDNVVEDLEQSDYNMDSLKERFNNLIELEFNIENCNQSDDARFLSVIAALYLPISYLASVFGITTMNTPAIVYLYISVPLLIVSLVFTMIFPELVRRFQKLRYPHHQSKHLQLPRQSFTMLGDELPDSADVPSNVDLNTRNRVSSHRNSQSYAPAPPLGSASGSRQIATLIPNNRERSRRRGERA